MHPKLSPDENEQIVQTGLSKKHVANQCPTLHLLEVIA